MYAEQRRVGRDELPERGDKLERAIRADRLLDEMLGADAGDDAGPPGPQGSRFAGRVA